MSEENSFQQLMMSAQAGNRQDYAKLLDGLSKRLRPFLLNRVAEAAVDDILQEILISIHKARHTYDSERPFMPWVMAIARFRLTDHLRSHYRHAAEIPDDGVWLENMADEKNVTDQLDWNETIKKSMETLPQKQQEVIQLMYYEDLSVREVAQKLGLGESAVKVNAHRGYKKLREQLKEDYGS